MVEIIVAIIVAGVLVWGATAIIAVIPIAEPFKKVATVLVIVAAVLWLLGLLFGGLSLPFGFHQVRVR